MKASPPPPPPPAGDEPAGGLATAEATPLKAWRKPTIRRILEGVLPVESGGPPEGTGMETTTYTHIS